MNVERLSEFADYLEEEVSNDEFDGNMEMSIRESAMGHAADCFAYRGLKIVNRGTYDDVEYEGVFGVMAISRFFDIDHETTRRIFCVGSKATRLNIVDRIREEL